MNIHAYMAIGLDSVIYKLSKSMVDRSRTTAEKKSVVIHDSIHGTFRLKSYELRVLDSFFLQRLRRINQMGVCDMVYPGARHTRFIHSVGAMYVAGRLSDYLTANDYESARANIRIRCRIAGLLHDVGQGPLSHWFDRLFLKTHHGHVQELKKRYGDLRTVQPHEALGSEILRCPPARKFFREFLPDSAKYDMIPNLITGNRERVDPSEKFLAQIINGYVDCDKIDYILRDSVFSGIPLPLDLSRLYEMICTYVEKNPDTGEKERILASIEKGAGSINSLLRARIDLYPTVYQHHAVRMLESLLIAVVQHCMAERLTVGEFCLDSPVKLLWLDDYGLACFLSKLDDPIVRFAYKVVCERRMYSRVLSLESWKIPDEWRAPLSQLFLDDTFEGQERRMEFKKDVLKAAHLKIDEIFEVDSSETKRVLRSATEEEKLDIGLLLDCPERPTYKCYNFSVVTQDYATEKKRLVPMHKLGYGVASPESEARRRWVYYIFSPTRHRQELSLAALNTIKSWSKTETGSEEIREN
jgi:HD superfamily phosphohydrolase